MVPERPVLVAPDSFKGSLSAEGAAVAISEGIARALPAAEVLLRPIADGGEGTVAAALRAGLPAATLDRRASLRGVST